MKTTFEAQAQGCAVTVVEKREIYSRPQWLFPTDASLKLLKKWNVDCPAFVQINHLEEQTN
jgi:hypothetical protein